MGRGCQGFQSARIGQVEKLVLHRVGPDAFENSLGLHQVQRQNALAGRMAAAAIACILPASLRHQ